MNDEMDAEEIARVLEGSATPEERARVLARADESPELLALLADSAAAMTEAGAAGAVAGTIVPPARSRIPRSAWMAIAAVLVIGVAIPMVQRSRDGVPSLPLAGIAAPASLNAARGGPALSNVRGGGEESRARASVSIGARLADYMVLVAAGDTAATTVAIEIAAALRDLPGGSAAATVFEGSGATTTVTSATVDALEAVLDWRLFRAAGWAELARVGAGSRSAELLGRDDLRSATAAMRDDSGLSPGARDAATALDASLRAQPVDVAAVEAAASRVLATLAPR